MPGLSRRLFISAAVVAFLVGLIAQMPAATALRWLLPDGIETRGISGTLWSGRIDAVAANGVAIGPVEWQLKPLALLTARVRADVEAGLPGGFANGRVTAGFGGLSLDDVRAQADLQPLTRRSSIGAAQGTLRVRLAHAELEALWPAFIEGNIDLLGLQYAASGPAVLGDFRLEFDGQTASDERFPVRGTLKSTGAGLFDVDGALALGPERSYSIQANVAPAPGAPANARNMLSLMPKRADGVAELRFEGQL